MYIAILIEDAENVQIRNTIIRHLLNYEETSKWIVGIEVRNRDGAIIRDCEIRTLSNTGLIWGVKLTNTNKATLKGNKIANFQGEQYSYIQLEKSINI